VKYKTEPRRRARETFCSQLMWVCSLLSRCSVRFGSDRWMGRAIGVTHDHASVFQPGSPHQSVLIWSSQVADEGSVCLRGRTTSNPVWWGAVRDGGNKQEKRRLHGWFR